MSESKRIRFVLTTVIGGVVFLIPVVFLGVIITKAAGFMMVIAKPMAAWLPIDTLGGVALANIIAVAGVIAVCFLAGLVARHALAGAFVKNLESKVLVNVPGYMMIKGLVNGFDESKADGLRPVALQLGSAERIGFEIQKLPDGRSMVFIPSVPSPWSGVTQVLPPEQISYLDIPISKVIEATENFGYGVDALLAAKRSS
jgi:uncharacterized membrane protein